jgi:hypothetical protein
VAIVAFQCGKGNALLECWGLSCRLNEVLGAITAQHDQSEHFLYDLLLDAQTADTPVTSSTIVLLGEH